MKDPTAHELAAKHLVEAVTGLRLVQLDPGGGAVPLADFMFVDAAGQRTGILEVTTNRSSDRLRFNDQRDRRNWKVPGTARSWLATVAHPKVDLEELHRRLIPLIIDLDREFGQADTPPPIDIEGLPRSILDPPRQELHDLGIIRVFSGPRDPSTSNGLVIVSLRPVGGFIGPSDVTDEVAQELSDLGNLAKLRAASSGESSELFVWLSDSCGSMALHSPILRGELGSSWPTEDVPLPAGVTGAWAATGPGAIDHLAHAVWHSVGGPWVVHQPPERTALRG